MLRWRLLSSAVLVSTVLTLLILDYAYPLAGVSALWLLPLYVFAAGMAAWELVDLIAAVDMRPPRMPVTALTICVTLAAAAPLAWPLVGKSYPSDCPLGRMGWPLAIAALSAGILALLEMRRFKPGQATRNLAGGVFVVVYIGVMLSFVLALRLIHGHQWGIVALASSIWIVKLSDAGAYFSGRFLGRTPMAPTLSPKKTMEGAVGGTLVAMIGACVYFPVVVPWLVGADADPGSWWRWLIYGGVLALFGILGDLSESLLKRDANQKDSASRLPGLGGMLDVVDSMLIAGPAAYACWLLGLVGPG